MKFLILIITCLLIVLTGCTEAEFTNGYQVGDVTHLAGRRLNQLELARANYCSDYVDSYTRHAALAIIRIYAPAVPPNGVCTGFNLLTPRFHNDIEQQPRDSPTVADTDQ